MRRTKFASDKAQLEVIIGKFTKIAQNLRDFGSAFVASIEEGTSDLRNFQDDLGRRRGDDPRLRQMQEIAATVRRLFQPGREAAKAAGPMARRVRTWRNGLPAGSTHLAGKRGPVGRRTRHTVRTTRNLVKRWQALTGKRDSALAKEMEVTRAAVEQWRRGEAKPMDHRVQQLRELVKRARRASSKKADPANAQ